MCAPGREAIRHRYSRGSRIVSLFLRLNILITQDDIPIVKSHDLMFFWLKYIIWIATYLRKLLTCSTTRAKWLVDDNPSLSWSESITSWTVVELSYLNDFVWPFSRNTFSTFGMSGCTESWEVIWLCVFEDGWNQKQLCFLILTLYVLIDVMNMSN